MLNGFKIVGICLTKIQDEITSKLMQCLYKETENTNYRLLIFNSFLDFFRNDKYTQGAASIYKAINYDVLDMLVITENNIYDKSLIEDMIAQAKKRKIPVLMLYGEREGCFSIVQNGYDISSEIVEHVIEVHNVQKLVFLAGIKGEKHSEQRLSGCRDAMARHGLTLKDEDIAYCDYWDVPVTRTIDAWVSEGRIPEAVICVNDSTARCACEWLLHYGYKVPEDVIVTGFDGLESISYYEPRLTTCQEDLPGLAQQCFKIIREAVEQKIAPYRSEEKYSLFVSESCGCRKETDRSYREDSARLYKLAESTQSHENIIYELADRLIEKTDLSEFAEILFKSTLPNSSVIINSDFNVRVRQSKNNAQEKTFTEKMLLLAACDENYVKSKQETFNLLEMHPNLAEKLRTPGMYIFQSIYVMDTAYGYYVIKTSDIQNMVRHVHRLFRVMNLAFGTLVSRFERDYLSSDIEKMHYYDSLTNLLNMRGLLQETERRNEELHQNYVIVSVYCIAQYRFIYENIGFAAAEDSVRFVAEALQIANPTDTVLARISENEFVVLNIVEDAMAIGSIIDRSVAVFFGIVEKYNSSLKNDYFVEVNCGCTILNPNWNGEITAYIKAANCELYLNRMKQGNKSVSIFKKGENLAADDQLTENDVNDLYRRFELLIEKNLFIYHFQPIVSAKTGEVYAYEALMRTEKVINMNPGEIISTAKAYRRLYDIELATFRNVLSFISEHREDFEGKRVFINTIPAHFLKGDDYAQINGLYHDVLRICTIEITEDNDISDEELNRIKMLGGEDSACQLAVDDYGTGCSNVVNVLRYKPQVIKIDRYLITEIHKDNNKQMFVRNIIEFAQANNILTIAEGVETSEELKAVIEYGADLIQGFYTARPTLQPLQKLSEEIRKEILAANQTCKA